MTLSEIKAQYALKKHGHHYDNAQYRGLITEEDRDEIAYRYAKAKLEEAAENAKMKLAGSGTRKSKKLVIDKESITNIPLD